jgi:hypothetical protein
MPEAKGVNVYSRANSYGAVKIVLNQPKRSAQTSARTIVLGDHPFLTHALFGWYVPFLLFLFLFHLPVPAEFEIGWGRMSYWSARWCLICGTAW